jgi:hypothetical protein
MSDYDDWDDPYNYSCHSVGMGGGCGIDCPVLNRGGCDIQDEIVETMLERGEKQELIDRGLIEDDDPFDAFDDAMEILK